MEVRVTCCSTPAGTVPVNAARVSEGFFRTLGVKPMLGRDFLPGEDQPGRAKIVDAQLWHLGQALWRASRRGGAIRDPERRDLHDRGRVAAGILRSRPGAAPNSGRRCWTRTRANSGGAATISTESGRLRDGVTHAGRAGGYEGHRGATGEAVSRIRTGARAPA